MSQRPAVLLIYTGGTIGMWADTTGTLRPMDLAHLEDQVPELSRIAVDLSSVAFEQPIDSSDMRPNDWVRIATLIGENYADFDGFVVLHGSDTMAYTASALSFLLEGLQKPVVLTGSQLPIGTIRTDAKENLITAIEIAAAKDGDGRPMVPEVCVYFEYQLMRGNRTVKVHAERFEAFRSPNWPVLAEAGVHLRWNPSAILPHRTGSLKVHTRLDDRIAVIRLFPGIRAGWLRHALSQADLRAVVLTTFGSGNAPTDPDLLGALQEAKDRGVLLLNVTQCVGGRVEQGRYATSQALQAMGVVPGADHTVEAAVAKLMFLLGRERATAAVEQAWGTAICGEFTLA
ncbi:MAG: type I asparaginase [Flavobacteriales bacterium]|jgi:L-asparaginase|nr:type I asparaginase [Flavobacteriales bacterium]MBP7448723.1 type I asparaginase [Flavobacteriales bacterium]HOZ40452.1 type I asparaginase [Flavobacteriales bacterium]